MKYKKKRIIYIYPPGQYEGVSESDIGLSLSPYFDSLILMFDGDNNNSFKNYEIKLQSSSGSADIDLPFSIVAADRKMLDYSNLSEYQHEIDLIKHQKIVEYFFYYFKKFDPDYIVSHSSDNIFSHTATLVAKRLGLNAIALAVRPYWPSRQILVDPLSWDNKQMKNVAENHFRNLQVLSKHPSKEVFKNYNFKSSYWAQGFDSIWKIIPKANFSKNRIDKIVKIYNYVASEIYQLLFRHTNKKSIKKSIVFFLSSQPEALLLGSDNRLGDQANFCQYLSYNIPINHKLIVKEHPGQLYRPIPFHRCLRRLKNVEYRSKKESTDDLIKEGDLFITFSGSVGVQVLCSGKKLISLGDIYYDNWPNAYKFNYNIRMDDFIYSVIKNPISSTELVETMKESFGSALMKLSIPIPEGILEGLATEKYNLGSSLDRLINIYDSNINEFGEL
jgi:hypothetical protein